MASLTWGSVSSVSTSVLAGFGYGVGAPYAGEPVEVVVAGGLVDILHAGVVVTIRHDRSREFGALANRKGRPAARTPPPATSPNDHVAWLPELRCRPCTGA